MVHRRVKESREQSRHVCFTLRDGGIERDIAPDIGIALRKIGLRLDKARGDVRVLVVDSVDRTPTPN